jgi:parallel beta-helix repeat protein
MGTIYRATDLETGQPVAVKTPRIALLEDPTLAKRFQREVHLLMTIRHPHVVPLLDMGYYNRVPFLVMPYLSGGSLRQRWHNPPQSSLEVVFPWLMQIAKALDFVHNQGWVHRDVKPENILFDEHGTAYLSDLGVVKLISDQDNREQTKLTHTGTAIGTPSYMAPEILLGRSYDFRVDQYALAVIVYEAFSGQLPYNASSLPSLIQQLLGPEATKLDQICPIPTKVANVVAQAMARDPQKRFASCRHFATALQKAFGDASTDPANSDSPPQSPDSLLPVPVRLEVPHTHSWKCWQCGHQIISTASTPPSQCPSCKADLTNQHQRTTPSDPSSKPNTQVVAPTVVVAPIPRTGDRPGVPSHRPPSPPNLATTQLARLPKPTRHIRPTIPIPSKPANEPARPYDKLALFLIRDRKTAKQVAILLGIALIVVFLIVVAIRSSAEADRRSPDMAAKATQAPSNSWQVSADELTLAEAVKQARPGDVIEIAAGVYTLDEPLIIDKSLRIRGAGREQTRILSWAEGFALKFTGDAQWTLHGVTVEHTGNRPANVVVVDSGMIRIERCSMRGGVWDQAQKRGGDGILLTGTARGIVKECVCSGNGLHGIEVLGQAQPVLEQNTCDNNKQAGIAYFDNAAGSAKNNTCRGNGYHGIQVNGQAQPVLEQNTCDNNKQDGIAYFHNAAGSAKNNTCRGNGYDGIGV